MILDQMKHLYNTNSKMRRNKLVSSFFCNVYSSPNICLTVFMSDDFRKKYFWQKNFAFECKFLNKTGLQPVFWKWQSCTIGNKCWSCFMWIKLCTEADLKEWWAIKHTIYLSSVFWKYCNEKKGYIGIKDCSLQKKNN